MEIEDIYGLIPEIQCIPGCKKCCTEFGVPSRTRVEDERIKKHLRDHGLELKQAEGTTCPYVCEEGCSIHPIRPLICRLYGNSPNYRCKMGASSLRPLNEDEEADIFQFYYENFF